MDWINKFNSAINYMEEHMKEEIDMEKVENCRLFILSFSENVYLYG